MEASGVFTIDDWDTNGSARRFDLNAGDQVFVLEIKRPAPKSPESRRIAAFQLTGTISGFFTISVDLEDEIGREYLIKRVESKKPELMTLELLTSYAWLRLRCKTMRFTWKITQESKSLPVPSCVGLRNDDSSLCYMNTILQLLYHTPVFANAIFEGAVRGQGRVDEKCDIVLQLARLFAQMSDENRMESLNTRDLTKSFGWTKNQRRSYHDPHEFLDVLLRRLDELLVERGCESLRPLYEGVRAIHETSAGLINFVDSYRKFSSLQKPAPEPFYLLELIRQVSELHLLPPDITLILQIEPEDLMIYADPNLIRQLLINLIKNAVQAIGTAKGRIHIRAYTTADEHIFVYVSNDGPVIPDDEAEEIFVPFFTTKKEGSGIGLSLSRQIMKLSGGTISLLRPGTNGWNTTFVLEFE